MDKMVATEVTCSGCGAARSHGIPHLADEDRVPCECGEIGVTVNLTFTGNVGLRDGIDLKQRQPGRGKVVHLIDGPNWFEATTEWHDRYRLIDKVNDRYVEYITDEAGNVVRDVDGPLSEHRGHGDDTSQPKAHP